ncbi:MAG: CoA transferase [Chloroflexi bacterium]|nr:CoA transferase [Chloroflexota bacterium]MDA8187589.1 CaiB/BaiF CoA-transferase family protein [Dehalococcoidales bacterium]
MQALTGIEILDLSLLFPGPYCTSLLHWMGAQVLKVERPGVGSFDRQVPGLFANLNWGKRSLTLDLGREEGRAIFHRLAEKADVIVEGFRPGVVTRLGVDYQAIRAINPKIVYCSISGFGQDGPNRDKPGHDVNYQALSGMLGAYSAQGATGADTAMPLADLSSGLFAAFAVVSALVERQRTGQGKYIDISMADGLFAWVATYDLMRFPPDSPCFQPGHDHAISVLPHYGFFETRDGRQLTLGVVGEDHLWKNLCAATGLARWADLDFAARVRARDEIEEELRRVLRQKDRDEWLRLFEAADVPATPVNTFTEAARNPQLVHRRLMSQMTGPGGLITPLVRNPILPPNAEIEGVGPPELGEHTVEVLEMLGYGTEQIERLRGSGII